MADQPVKKYRYSFSVRGRYPNGNTAKMSGYVYAEDGYPFSAFEDAVKVCEDITPGLIVDRQKPGQITLRKLKR